MSPENLEEKLNNVEAAVFGWFGKRSQPVLMVILIAFLALAYFLISGKLTFRYPFLYFSNFIFSFKTVILISLLSLIFLYETSAKRRLIWVSLIFSGCAAFDFYHTYWYGNSREWWAALLIPLQSIVGFGAWNLSRKWNKTLVIWGYAIFSVGLFAWSFYQVAGVGWFYFHQPVLFCAFIIAMMLEEVHMTNEKKWALVTNPAHLFLSVNYPIDGYLETVNSDRTVWSTGVVHIIKAMTALYLTCLFYLAVGESNLFLASFKDYVMYLMVVIAVGNTVTGVSRMFLIDVPVCSNYAFLSRSPLDFMKRENAHAYAFSLRFFYFNFLKITKNPLVIVLGYFLVFPFYRNILVYFTRNQVYEWNNFWVFLWWGYLFWILLLLAIIFFPGKLLHKYKVNEWWHVFFNHVIMYLVFLAYRYVYLSYS